MDKFSFSLFLNTSKIYTRFLKRSFLFPIQTSGLSSLYIFTLLRYVTTERRSSRTTGQSRYLNVRRSPSNTIKQRIRLFGIYRSEKVQSITK